MKLEKKISQDLLNLMSQEIASQIGIYFSPEQAKILERKLTSALPELGFKDLTECIDSFLQKRFTKLHLDVLAKHLTIGETYFFRDKHAFTMLKELILPDIMSKHQDTDRTLRIWSAACATGEEPYSIAILLKELINDWNQWNVHIIATDLNLSFLHKAREGKYKSWSFRSTPKEIVERYFEKNEKGEISILPSIKKMVQFFPLNLINGAYSHLNPHLNNLDLILCNNVLIYFSKDQIKNTMKNMTYVLRNEGWLYVSSIEVPFINDPQLTPINGHKTTVFKKSFSVHKKNEMIIVKPIPPTKKEFPKTPLTQEEFYECCVSMYHAGFYSEVIHQLTQSLTPNTYKNPDLLQQMNEVLLLVHALSNQGKFSVAKEWCERALAINKLDIQLYYLYAAVLQGLGDEENALNALRGALYLNSDMIAAHFSMAMLLFKKNNTDAKRHLAIALKLLKKMPGTDLILGMEKVTALELTAIVLQLMKGESDG